MELMQVTLTPSESKKLISKALLKVDFLKKALKNGIVVVHPSSTTYFLYKELTGKYPEKSWVCGVIVKEGACINEETLNELIKVGATENIGKFNQFWVFEKGKLIKTPPISELLEVLGEGDVYIKAGNAIDPLGNVGVLIGAPDRRGTVGRFYEKSKERGFKIIIPIGLEKLVPSVDEAVKVADPTKIKYSMGMPLGLFKLNGYVVTEIEAVKLLCGAKATLIASGGLSGAEGSVTLVVEGNENQLRSLKEVLAQVKGAELPKIKIPDCKTCAWKTCKLYNFENIKL